MKPTISNAFNDESVNAGGSVKRPQTDAWGLRRMHDSETGASNAPAKKPANRSGRRNPGRSLAASLAAMQADLRETDFGWSLDLSPMQAIDALQALSLMKPDSANLQFLVTMEQSAWRDEDEPMPIASIVDRLALATLLRVNADQLVMDESSLQQLVSLCQPSRLIVVAVDGAVDERDAAAMTAALEAGRSPLLAELRAVAAMEVLGDRSIVLHCRDKATALALVADNFRHYLAALNNAPAKLFEAPEGWQIERLLSATGVLTIRPIETQRFSTSIDVGINTNKDRFNQPADQSLIYDVPSNTWHDEP